MIMEPNARADRGHIPATLAACALSRRAPIAPTTLAVARPISAKVPRSLSLTSRSRAVRIYLLTCDVNHYQSFLPENEDVWDTEMLTFDAAPKESDCSPPPVFVSHPTHHPSNFLPLAAPH